MKTRVVASTTLVLTLLITISAPAASVLRPTAVQADQALPNIDLTDRFTAVYQTDPRWAAETVPTTAPLGGQTIGACGCFYSVMAMMLNFWAPTVFGTTLPWFPVYLRTLGGSRYENEPRLGWYPPYLVEYLRSGNRQRSFQENWGTKAIGDCGITPYFWALEEVGSPSFPGLVLTGITMRPYSTQGGTGLDAKGRQVIDDNLRAGRPTIVGYMAYEFDDDRTHPKTALGGHAVLVIGWDAQAQQYVVIDPLYREGATIPDNGPSNSYDDWLSSIFLVIDAVPAFGSQSYLLVDDDPSPIQFAITDPFGRRSGFNPVSGGNDHAAANAYAYDIPALANSVNPSTPTDDGIKGLQVEDPQDGIWRVEAIGTGSGTYHYDIDSVIGGVKTVAATVTGSIVVGQVIKQEVRWSAGAALQVATVSNFTPEAVAGSDRGVRVGLAFTLDGRRSFDADGTVTGWSWDFGDGTSATGPTVSHTYTQPGDYPVSLTVTDNGGATRTTTITVQAVLPPVITTERVSISTQGLQGNQMSGDSLFEGYTRIESVVMTDDGNQVFFDSRADNLVASDNNFVRDIFVHDRASGTTERVSVTTDGSEFSEPSALPTISADGRYVVFRNGSVVLLRDRMAGTTEPINLDSGGLVVSDGDPFPGGVSNDGRFVVFDTIARLTPDDRDDNRSIYIRDRLSAQTIRISAPVDEVTNGGAFDPVISGAGQHVVFTARDPLTGVSQLYEVDPDGTNLHLVSASATGVPAGGGAVLPSLSADGRYLAFLASADAFVPGNSVPGTVFVKDLMTGSLEQIPDARNPRGAGSGQPRPQLSSDGRYVAVLMRHSDPVFGRSYGPFDLIGVGVFDRSTRTLRRADLRPDGQKPSATGTPFYALSGDGRWLAYSSYGADLVPFDTNNTADVFVRDMATAVPPVADVSGPYVGWQTTSEVVYDVRFRGSASSGRTGDPLTATWDFGDSSPLLVTSSLTPAHTYTQHGAYTVTLIVANGGDISAPVSTRVDIHPAPTFDAVVTPRCLTAGQPVTLSGFLPLRPALQHGWNYGDGLVPHRTQSFFGDWGQRIDVDAVAPDFGFTATFSTPAWLSAGLHTVGGQPFSVPCPPSSALIADAGGPYQAVANQPVTLDGTHSLAPNGAALTYLWDFGDGTTGTGAAPVHIYQAASDYYVSLLISDGSGNRATTSSHDVTIVHVSEEQASVVLSPDSSSVTVPEGSPATLRGDYHASNDAAVSLTASVGTISDLGSGRWQWDFTPTEPSDSQTVTITDTLPSGVAGTAQFELVVTDAPPIITGLTISGVGTACLSGTQVTASVTASDPSGPNEPLSGTIDWGDGTTAIFNGHAAVVQHTYAAGSYTVTATVTDDAGGTATKSTAAGAVQLLYAPSSILQPINADGTSNFKLGSTLPAKITVTDCTGALVATLNPTIGLARISTGDGGVNEVVSTAAADSGTTMRWTGSQYLFNLSTKRSQFNAGADLVAGRYQLTITEPHMFPVTVRFDLRP